MNKAELIPYSSLLNFVADNEEDLSIYINNIEYIFNGIRDEEVNYFYNLATNNKVDNTLHNKVSIIKKSIISSNGFRQNILQNKLLAVNSTLSRKINILKHVYIDFIQINSEKLNSLQFQVNNYYRDCEFNFPTYLKDMRFEENQVKRKDSYESLPKLQENLYQTTNSIVDERNKIARECGFVNFPELSLYNQGFNIKDFKNLILSFEEETRELYTYHFNKEKSKLNMKIVNPYDVMYLFAREEYKFQNLSLNTTEYVSTIVGFLKENHIFPESSNIRMEFMDNQQPPAITLNKSNEIIVLINKKLNGLNFLELTFHELGHAIHAQANLENSFLLQGESTAFSEGIAQTIEILATSYEFLTKYMGLDETEYQKSMEIKTKYYLYLMRKLCADNLTRIQYYESKGKDFNELKIQNDSKFLLLNQNNTSSIHLAPTEIIGSLKEFTEPSLLGFFIAKALEYKYTNDGRIDLMKFKDDISNLLLKPGNNINWNEKIGNILTGELFIPPKGGLITWKRGM